MKKYLTLFTAIILGLSAIAEEIVSPTIEEAIKKYKSKNYVGCIQDTQDITKADPSNALAHYYMAISYANIGNANLAKEAYDKVIALSTNYTLSEYAQKGKTCAESPEACNEKEKNIIDLELENFIKSGKSLSKETEKKLQKLEIEKLKHQINKEADEKSELPTNDEIAQAVKTLAKAGFTAIQTNQNPYIQAQQTLAQNPEYMQLQMMLGNNQNNNNDFVGMLPYFMTQQNNNQNTNLSQDMIKNMMMSSMVGNISTTFDIDNKH